MIAAVIQFIAVAVLLGIASVKDIRTREIPDWISVCVALTAFINFRLENLWGIIAAAIFFAVALWTCKIGGGDVKLIAALSVVCGLWSSLALLFFAQLSMLVYFNYHSVLRRRTFGKRDYRENEYQDGGEVYTWTELSFLLRQLVCYPIPESETILRMG